MLCERLNLVQSEASEMFKMVSVEIGRLQVKGKVQGYLQPKDKELYNNCIAAIKELYKNIV